MKNYQRLPLIFEGRELDKVYCVISLRNAGNMGTESGNLSKNRLSFIRELGIEPECLFGCRQTHSKVVSIAVGEGSVINADGLVTGGADANSLALSVTVADCLPIYLFDTASGAFGVCHSGWKGTGIVIEALNLMKERFGTSPSDVAALLGPCIQAEHYNIDEERARIFEQEFGFLGGGNDADYPLGTVIKRIDGRCFLDMQAANAALLTNWGIKNISFCKNSTFNDERLGSFRREGAGFTKMLALITLNPQD